MTTPQKDRNGTYIIRKRIPKSLKPYTSKSEIKRSLQTKDAAEAKLRYPAVMAEIESELQLISLRSQPERVLGTRERAALCDHWLVEKLAEIENDDWALADWFTQTVGDKKDEVGEATAGNWWSELVDDAVGRYEERKEVVATELNALILRYSLQIREDSPNYKALSLELLKRFISLYEVAKKRLSGDVTAEPDASLAGEVKQTNHSSGKKVRLSGLVERWKTFVLNQKAGDERSAQNQIRDYSKAFQRFIVFTKDAELSRLTRKDVADFRDMLYTLPARAKHNVATLPFSEQSAIAKRGGLSTLSNNSVRNAIVHLRALFSFAMSSGLMDENVAEGVEPKRTRKAHVVDNLNYYNEDDLKAIFSSRLFTKGYRPPKANYGEAPYWVPIILYYTGARIEEISQLKVSHVRYAENVETHYIRIDESGEGASVKQGSSARDVPIADDLIALGFLEYVESLPKGGALFPRLTQSARGKLSGDLGKWWGKYLKEEIARDLDGRKPAHAFRHTFETNARILGVRLDVTNSITGRTTGHSGESYGGWFNAMKDAVNKLPSITQWMRS